MFKFELVKKKYFGEIAIYIYVIKFQKRKLSHAHMLVILKSKYKPLKPETYHQFISAKILDLDRQRYLHSLVVKHMPRGPCGELKKR